MSEFPKIPGYKITKILGKGGMGIVYLAVQEALDRQVALKVTLPSLYEEDETFLTRFVREAKATAMLQHPNIITIYDAGVFENSSYMAMEYISSGTLADVKSEDLTHNKICQLFISIAKGLGVAHQAGLVHRDIKPDNILIDKDGNPLVTDFGIVKTQNANATLTKVGDTIGTPHYMSPEQIKAEKLDGRSDIYSLGIVLYNFLEGHVPFSDTTPSAVYIKHVTEEPAPLSIKNSIFQSIVSKALEKEPQDRYNNTNEMVVALEAIMQVRHTPASSPAIKPSEISRAQTKMVKPVTEIPQGSGMGLKIGIAVAVLALLIGGYFGYDNFLQKDNTQVVETIDNVKAGLQTTQTPQITQNTTNNNASNADNNQAQEQNLNSDYVSNNEVSENETRNDSKKNNDLTAQTLQDITQSEATETEQLANNESNKEPSQIPNQNQINNNLEENSQKDDNIAADDTTDENKQLATVETTEQQATENIDKNTSDNPEEPETLLVDKYTTPADEKIEETPISTASNDLITVKNLLQNANQDLNQSKLLRPIGNNAYEKYNEVLRLDPNNKFARLGIIKIIKKYQALARNKLSKNNYKDALSYINSAITIRQKFDEQGLTKDIRPIIIQAYSVQRLTQDKQSIMNKMQLAKAEKQREEQARLAKQEEAKMIVKEPDLANIYAQAKKTLAQEKYLQAKKLFEQAAEHGHMESQNELGHIYLRELGVKRDYKKALSWFLKSAKQGYAPAQDNLGLMYFKGYGSNRDFDESFFWYAKAANQGYADSQGILGAMYEYGRGVKKSSYQAVQWYKKAAKQGNAFAIKKLRKRGIKKYD